MTKLDGAQFSAVVGLVCLGVVHAARADALADPTRPAPEWLAAQPTVPGAEVIGADTTPGLRVLVIGPTRKFAIIDGQIVRLGGSYNGAKLVSIHPGGVVLQQDGSKESLSMSPAVEKKVRVSKSAPGRPKSKKNVLNGEGQ